MTASKEWSKNIHQQVLMRQCLGNIKYLENECICCLLNLYCPSEVQINGEILYGRWKKSLLSAWSPLNRKESNKDFTQDLWNIKNATSLGNKNPHQKVIKPNEQHQFDLLHLPHNVFEGNAYKYILHITLSTHVTTYCFKIQGPKTC